MASPDRSSNQPVQPALSDLLVGYLHDQIERRATGLDNPDTTGEVVPFESVPVQPVDARLAWREAVAVARYYYLPQKDEKAAFSGGETSTWPAPPDWPATVSSQEPAAAVSFSFGNFPQLVRDLQTLLPSSNLSALLPSGTNAASSPAVHDWAAAWARERRYPDMLLAVGLLRLCGQFDEAAELLHRHQAAAPAPWQAACANEEAALAWHRGQVEEAARLWQKQAPTVPVLFNRGMSSLFLGKREQARPALTEAMAQLSESDGWHHLGGIYLALADMA